ncbi:hypothetical protein BCR33DRAFT_846216 [Rhizoclosmatium globosum]|uniref:Threonine/serine exporter-like N-terminal domain-containing protein n=1 Tax=Rhizoclosmatium globosum TaxID=329046 RepID=A0A1Y2CWK3_9FUNG|nr:hypothetical protein BCR33DRAFT_846216 [Rhizoclosmatium globosum]|eukprot:ORY51412.1 hypothetical protein BCR33DRAFT_846216 [Rhizoclosmatium globosum]
MLEAGSIARLSQTSLSLAQSSLASISQIFHNGQRHHHPRQVWKPSDGKSICGKYTADTEQVKIIYGIAQALFRFGAPLTRIPHIVQDVGEVLGVPTSIQCLPQILMISLGDGTPLHPSRTQFMSLETHVDVGKVYDVDRLAMQICDMAQKKTENKDNLESDARHVSDRFHSIDADDGATPINKDASKMPRGSTTTKETHENISPFSIVDVPTHMTNLEILAKLDEIVTKKHSYYLKNFMTHSLTCAVQASAISVLNYGGSAGDGLFAFLLGSFSGWYIEYQEKNSPQGVPELLVAMIISAIAHVINRLWPGNYPIIFPGTNLEGAWEIFDGTPVCQSVFGLAALIRLFPGTQITLGMLELNDNPVAGSVRMFYAFIRALKLGYGMSIGSRFGAFVLSIIGLGKSDFGVSGATPANCPTDFSSVLDLSLGRFMASIFFSIAGIMQLKAHRSQMPKMMLATTASFVIFTFARRYLPTTEAAGIASFGVAVIANVMARWTNEIAVPFILAAMQYLGPGAVGVRGAAKVFQETSDGTTFGMDMIAMAMALAIGIFLANKLVFSLQPSLQAKWLDKAMTF